MLVSFSLSILRSVSLLLNSGPYERSNTTDFPLKYAWQCCISWNQMNMLRIRKKLLLTRPRTSNWICKSLFPLDRLCQKNIRQETSRHFCQNFLNVFMNGSQCYKSFACLYLQVLKWRAIFDTSCSLKHCQIRCTFGYFYFLIQSTLAVEQRHNEFDNTRDYKWFLN